jgi:hypothetical protein
MWENMLHVKGCNSLASNDLFAWEEQQGLGTIMIYDGENGIISFLWWQINDEVQGNYTKGYKGMLGHDWEQGDLWFCHSCLGRLTGSAPLDVVLYKLPEPRPPVPL